MTGTFGELLLVGVVASPLVGAGVSVAGACALGRGQRTAAGFAWLSALLALVTAALVGVRGPFGITVAEAHGQLLLGLWANQLTVILMGLVCVVGALVQSFSLRYLQGDRTAHKFRAAANVVIVAMVVVCTATTILLLVAAWLVAGIAFLVVLGSRPDLVGVRAATRRARQMFALGDVALVAATVLVWVRDGNIDLVSDGALQSASAHLGGLTTLVALLVIVAAMTRSAQGLFGRWLLGTVSAPTPTSALLHAGVVNGGGILLVRLGVLAGNSALAMIGTLVIAGLTAIVATVAMSHKADAKGTLVFSTIGQMGFMIAECAVGAYLAAVVHLIGHALYKATLFFGSGSQVPHGGHAPAAPTVVVTRAVRVAATAATTAVTLGAMAAIPGDLAHRGSGVLLIFAAATVCTASWSWWGGTPASARWMILGATALLVVGTLYGLVLAALGRWVTVALPTAGSGTLDPWWLAVLAGAAIVVSALTRLSAVKKRLIAALIDATTAPGPLVARCELGKARNDRAPVTGNAEQIESSWEESLA